MRKFVIFIINHLVPIAIIFNVILLFIPLPELLVDIGLILTWGFCLLLFFIVRNINEGFYTLPRKILYLTLLLLALEISYSRIIITFESRIRRIFTVAANNNNDILILGAFGCGAFRNPPDLVAKVFFKVMREFKLYFEMIEYAIFCAGAETENYDAFNKEWKLLMGK